MFLSIIFSILLLLRKICFEIKFMSVEPSVEIDKVSPVQLPLRLKESSDFVKESRCSFVKRTLLLLYGKIRSQYIFLSSQSDPVRNDTVMKTYNNNMGSVDLNDQTWGYYMAGRKSKKWWRCLTWFFVDVAIVNAYILEKLSPHHWSRTQLAFHLDLVKLLIGNFLAQRLSASSGHLEGGHWPIKFSKGHFKRCLKRNKEMWCRMACELCANAFV